MGWALHQEMINSARRGSKFSTMNNSKCTNNHLCSDCDPSVYHHWNLRYWSWNYRGCWHLLIQRKREGNKSHVSFRYVDSVIPTRSSRVDGSWGQICCPPMSPGKRKTISLWQRKVRSELSIQLTRLALQLILDKGFELFSFQLLDLQRPGIVIYCHYLPVSGLGNLRACCLPWMW